MLSLFSIFFQGFLSLSAFPSWRFFFICKFVLSVINFAFTTGSLTGFDIFSEDTEISPVFVYHLPFHNQRQPRTFLNEGSMLTQHDLHLEIY